MKKMGLLLVSFLALGLIPYASAQKEKPSRTEIEVGDVLTGSMTHVQRMFLPLADAMPEDRYGFVPTNGEFKGVRSFGEQLKHVATTNYVYASSILGEKPPVDIGENEDGPTSLKHKEEIIKYLSDSFAYVKKAVATVNEKNIVAPIKNPFGQGNATRLAMSNLIIEHCFDHYGQMVEYLRMNGVVPPASQR
jgi:uncharacterized damage-inducible protein DinB